MTAADRDHRAQAGDHGQRQRTDVGKGDQDRLSTEWQAPERRQATAAQPGRRDREGSSAELQPRERRQSGVELQQRERDGTTMERERRDRDGRAAELPPRERRESGVELQQRERDGITTERERRDRGGKAVELQLRDRQQTGLELQSREREGIMTDRDRRDREGVAVELQPRARRQTGVGVELRERPGWAPSPWIQERQRPTAQGPVIEDRQRLATPVPAGQMPPAGPGYRVEAEGGELPAIQQPQYYRQPAYRAGSGQPLYGAQVQGPSQGLSPGRESARIDADRRFADQDDQGQALEEQQQHQRWWDQQGRREEARSRREWRRLQDLEWQAYGPTPPEYGPLPPGYNVAPKGPPMAETYPRAYVAPRVYAPEVPYAEVPPPPPRPRRLWQAPGPYGEEYVPE